MFGIQNFFESSEIFQIEKVANDLFKKKKTLSYQKKPIIITKLESFVSINLKSIQNRKK